MDFVPSEKRSEAIPCHHIPLNENGDTIASLEGRDEDFKVQEAMKDWLHRTIHQLQAAGAKVETEVFVL
jgi:hypothetical protein